MPTPGKKKTFIFCVHAHQPVGNFGRVFEEAVDKCYRPFFDVVERHPRVPVSLHLSGSLIDWLETARPDFLDRLRKLSGSHEIEFLGGAYYEPIYGLIPKRDLEGQIARMRGKVEQLFGQRPGGAWLTERVWDPELVGTLAASGVAYTVLDDVHFAEAGVRAPVTGHYTVVRGGDSVDAFASIQALRYAIPFRAAEEAVRAIRQVKTAPGRAIVFADDCEKFGLWPGTARWVYGADWLDRFFTLLEDDETIRLTTFSRARAESAPVAKVTIPHSSYAEMMEWSGGRFYNFFDKYSESRYMKERMWQVSETVNGDEESRTALYRAQCNCSYWHGVFGGLYLHHLRASVFENLIKAEKTAQEGIRLVSFESGGRWRVGQRKITGYFNGRYGAALEELDFLPKSVNLLCTLQRRPEPYHRFAAPGLNGVVEGFRNAPLTIHQMLGAKEKNLETKLYYDPFRKHSFLDHFFEEKVARPAFERSSYREAGDFVDGPYEAALDPAAGSLVFERPGTLRLGRKKHPLRVRKTVLPQGENALRVSYRIRNEGPEAVRFVFGVEFNFSIGEASMSQGLEEDRVRERAFRDSWRDIGIVLRFGAPVSLTAVPLETVSESEGGLEGTFQQLSVLTQRALEIGPGESADHILELEVR